MDRNRGQRPGYGYSARPSPPDAPATNTSIFGLISKVNKGILKNPKKDRQSSSIPQIPSAGSDDTATPQKSDFNQPEIVDKEKQDAFLLAKSRVEQIQKGLWKTSHGEKKTESLSEPFKVPQLPGRPLKQGQSASGVSGEGDRDKGHVQGQSASGVSGEGDRDKGHVQGQQGHGKAAVSLVEYEDDDNDDQPKRSSSYNREKALEEIDRYRAVGRGGRGAGNRELVENIETYGEQGKDYETEEYDVSSYRKERHDSSVPEINPDSKSHTPDYEPYRKIDEDSRNRYIDETKEEKYYSAYEVFDYGHTSDCGNNAEVKEDEKEMKTRKFEETKEANMDDRGIKDRDMAAYSREYTRGNYDTSGRYQEEFRNRQPDSQNKNKNLDSYREQYGERYHREYQGGITESRRNWDDSQTTDTYSREYGTGYGDRSRQYGRDSRDLYPGYSGYDNYSDDRYDNRQTYDDSYDRDYGSRYEVNLTDNKTDYNDRIGKKLNEGYNDQGSIDPETRKDVKSRKDSGDMLYEDFLFGDKGKEQTDKESKFDTSKDSRHFEEERQRRFTESGPNSDRQRRGNKDKQTDFGEKSKDKYGLDEVDLSAADQTKPFYETRWASEKSETVSGAWKDRQRDSNEFQPMPVVSAVVGSSLGVAKAVLGPGILCKDCNLAFLDAEVYEVHLKSDAHLLTLQKKAQELFQMSESRKGSRFSPADPFPLAGTQPTGPQPTVVTVIPPKPKGPLQADSIGCNSLNISWSRLTSAEEHMVEKYTVEYRNARETHWVTVGNTNKHDYMIDGLQDNTDYLFRVYAVYGVEKSEVLESVLITTRRKKELPSRRPRRPSPDRRSRPSPERRIRPSPERRIRTSPERRRRPSPERQSRPSPERRRRPSPERQSRPSPERQSRPSPERRRRPSPERQSRPSPERRRRPSPERQSRPSPERRRRPSPERQSRPSPERQSRPSPERRRRPSPERHSRPSPEGRKTSKDREGPSRERTRSDERDRDRERKSSQENDRDRGQRNSRETDKDDKSSRLRGSDNREKVGDSKDDKKLKDAEKSGQRKTDNKTSKEQSKTSAEKKETSGYNRGKRSESKEADKRGDGRKKAADVEKKQTDESDVGRRKTEEEDGMKESSGEGSGEPANEVECLLYHEIPNIEEQPLLGLGYLWEIVSYKPTVPVRYLCKLCNTKGFASPVMLRHITGFPHKMEFFKKYDMTVYDTISMIPARKEQIERLNYEGRLVEDKHGRGAVKVMIMLNPQDTDGKVMFKDPVEVKAPPPDRGRVTEPAPEATMIKSKFRTYFEETVRIHELEDIALIGLSYLKEYFHPTEEDEPPRYTCALCNVICTDKTVVFHMIGKKHRLAYLKTHYPEYWDLTTKSQDGKQLVIQKAKEIEEKHGSGELRCIVAKSPRLWRHNLKNKEAMYAEEEEAAEEEAETREPPTPQVPMEVETEVKEGDDKEENQGIKFGIKKVDPSSKHVKPVNVLDQAKPKTKEAFDWNKENAALQAKIQNQTIIKSTRKSKFITVYSEFFKRYPVIGLQWVTEFQKPDPKMESWYMCFMCQHKLQWKNILDHVTSSSHRINYMKKNYEKKYQALLSAINTNKTRGRAVIESYSREIMQQESPVSSMEVMLELNINKEALKSVMKVKDSLKSTASTSAIFDIDQSKSITTSVTSSSSAVTSSVSSVTSSSAVSSTVTADSQVQFPAPLLQPLTGQQQLPPLHQPPPPLHQVAPHVAPVSVGHVPVQSRSDQLSVQQAAYYQQAAMPAHSAVYTPMSTATLQHIPPPTTVMNSNLANRFPMPLVNTRSMPPHLPLTGTPRGPMSAGYSVRFPQQMGGPSLLPAQQSGLPFRPPATLTVSSRPIASPAFTPMVHQQPLWQTTMGSSSISYQPPVNVSQNAPQSNSQIGVSFHSQTGLLPSQQVPLQTGPQLADGFQKVIEKQAEKVLTQQILHTGQFPSPGTKVSLANDGRYEGKALGQSQKADDNLVGRFNDTSEINQTGRFGQGERSQSQRGEKRPIWKGGQTEAFDESKRARMEGNNWQNREERQQTGSRFENEGSRSRSPYGKELSRKQYDRDRERGYCAGQDSRRGPWSERNTEGNRRSSEYDNNRKESTRSYERYDAYRDQATLKNTERDIYNEDVEAENEYDMPLSSRELENLVQMYSDRTDDDYVGIDDLEDEFENARNQDEYFDESYNDFGNDQCNRDTEDWNEHDSYRKSTGRRDGSQEKLNRREDDKRGFRRSRFEPDDRRSIRDEQDLRRDSQNARRGSRDTYDDGRRRNRAGRDTDYDQYMDDRRDESSDRYRTAQDRGHSGDRELASRSRGDRNRRERLLDDRDRSPRSDSDRSQTDRSVRTKSKDYDRSRSDRFSDLETSSRHDGSLREKDRWSRSDESPQRDLDTRSRPGRFEDDSFERMPRSSRLLRDDPDISRPRNLHDDDFQRSALERQERWPEDVDSCPDPSREEIDKLLRKVNTSLMRMPEDVRQSVCADVARDMPRVMDTLDRVFSPSEGRASHERSDRLGPTESRGASRGRGRGSFRQDTAGRGDRSRFGGSNWTIDEHENSGAEIRERMGAVELPQGREDFGVARGIMERPELRNLSRDLGGIAGQEQREYGREYSETASDVNDGYSARNLPMGLGTRGRGGYIGGRGGQSSSIR